MKYLAITTLGREGRFGNQLFVAAAGLGLARKFNCPLILPDDWQGRKIFKNDMSGVIWEPFNKIQNQFRKTPIDYIPSIEDLNKYSTLDLFGYWQFQEAIDLYTAEDVRNWFKWHEWVKEKFPFTTNGNIIIHKRRGDYVRQPHLYCNILNESFDKAINDIAIPLVLKQWGECAIETLEEENPQRDEYCDRENIGFLPDFMKMVNAYCVVRSNSTFSWWPTVFGQNKVVAPVVEDKVGWYNPEWTLGNWPRMADSKYHPNSKLTDLYLKDK